MPKNIVFCADGTWNGPGRDDGDDPNSFPTNVFKLFWNLAGIDTPDSLRLANEQERVLQDARGEVGQITKYLHGVGDSSNPLVRLLGGTLGAGIITRIVRGYTFLSRNYVPNDKVILVGFSRGAYTARALAGMIVAKGLLDPSKLDLTDKENAYRLGAAVWYDYRKTMLQTNPDWFGRLEETLCDLPGFITSPPTPNLIANVQLEAVAVWDTVGSLGIPEYVRPMTCIDAFRFADTKLSPRVARGFHAVSLDEQRADFTPTLWDPDTMRILQVLFPGAHADVGGGYPLTNKESGLSDGALDWMMGQLSFIGVLFRSPLVVQPNPDATGTAHQPWQSFPWTALGVGSRDFSGRTDLVIDPSIIDRKQDGPVRADPVAAPAIYDPQNLP